MTTPGLQFLVAVVAGWVNRNQQEVIEYLESENRVLRQRLSMDGSSYAWAVGEYGSPTHSAAGWPSLRSG